MFNLLAVRSDPVPRLTRLLGDPSTPTEQQYAISDQLEHEKHKAKQGHLENTLRRNNLLPIVFELFKAMGKHSDMGELVTHSGPHDIRGEGHGCTV